MASVMSHYCEIDKHGRCDGWVYLMDIGLNQYRLACECESCDNASGDASDQLHRQAFTAQLLA